MSPPVAHDTAAPFVPDRPTLPKLRAAAAGCTGCHLYKLGTQTVFGEGSADADVVFVGEQPGDQEDLAGKPFVGPAGRVLDEGLAAAGIDRSQVYVTNAVKHFKWEPRGKRRIHQKPNWAEMTACRPWLEAELAVVQPDVLVCLGATAAQSLLGRQFRVTKTRGVPVESDLAPSVVATVHPSSILRAPDEGARQEAMQDFVRDLKAVAKLIKSP
jgi:uracil-DNA glycosylase